MEIAIGGTGNLAPSRTRSTSMPFEPIAPDAGSGAEELVAAAPGAKVVKAFNTTFAGTLAGGGEVGAQPFDVFVAAIGFGSTITIVS